jgi:hypothetical protein
MHEEISPVPKGHDPEQYIAQDNYMPCCPSPDQPKFDSQSVLNKDSQLLRPRNRKLMWGEKRIVIGIEPAKVSVHGSIGSTVRTAGSIQFK